MFFRTKNTPEKGTIRYIIFKEDDVWFGVALELNLVVDAENPNQAFATLNDAVRSYISTTKIAHIRHSVLNQPTSREYSRLWKDLNQGKVPQLKKHVEPEEVTEARPIQVANFGVIPQFA